VGRCDQNLDQGSNFSSKINILRIASKRTECSPHCHEPNTTRLGSNGRREREISRSVRIVKQVKKGMLNVQSVQVDVAESVHDDMAEVR
jgi:hypothetical protein